MRLFPYVRRATYGKVCSPRAFSSRPSWHITSNQKPRRACYRLLSVALACVCVALACSLLLSAALFPLAFACSRRLCRCSRLLSVALGVHKKSLVYERRQLPRAGLPCRPLTVPIHPRRANEPPPFAPGLRVSRPFPRDDKSIGRNAERVEGRFRAFGAMLVGFRFRLGCLVASRRFASRRGLALNCRAKRERMRQHGETFERMRGASGEGMETGQRPRAGLPHGGGCSTGVPHPLGLCARVWCVDVADRVPTAIRTRCGAGGLTHRHGVERTTLGLWLSRVATLATSTGAETSVALLAAVAHTMTSE